MSLAWHSPHYGRFALTWAETAALPVGEALSLLKGLKTRWDEDNAALRKARRGR
jgi:hypothetical protein